MYPEDRIYEEVAFIAYYFHWTHDEILSLPHWERKRWCEEISRINDDLNTDSETTISEDPRVDDIPVVDFDEQSELFKDE